MKNKKFIVLGILSITLLTVLIGCGRKSQQPDEITSEVPSEKTAESTVTVESNNDFALVDKLYEEEKGNVVVSNTSVNMALAMLLEGSGGETQSQLETYLGHSQEEAKEINRQLIDTYNNSSDEDLKINIANSLWSDKDMVIKKEYMALLDDYFEAEAENLDFSDPQAADKINNWVSEKTNGLIKEIVRADSLKDMAAVLINTVYFHANWVDEYDSAVPGTFNGQDAEMLEHVEDVYFENDNAVAFAKPYNGNFEFIGILPKNEGEFTLEELDIDGLLETRTRDYDVATSMPKFKNEYSVSLSDVLKKSGVICMFGSDSDLTDISDGFFVSDILHKTYISVDEHGTEAAAATSAMVALTSMAESKEVKEVYLDRPFAFMIYDTKNETPLFVGKIVNLAN